jgi:hypothetical protein
MDALERPKPQEMYMRFGTWNVRSLYGSGSLKTVSGELAKPKLDLVGVQKVRWDKGGTEPAGDDNFFYRNGNTDHHLGTGFFVHKEDHISSSVSDRMSHIFGVILLFLMCRHQLRINDNKKNSFYEELECIWSIPEVPHEKTVRRFQCKGKEGRYF